MPFRKISHPPQNKLVTDQTFEAAFYLVGATAAGAAYSIGRLAVRLGFGSENVCCDREEHIADRMPKPSALGREPRFFA
jgi:hypothetical protein